MLGEPSFETSVLLSEPHFEARLQLDKPLLQTRLQLSEPLLQTSILLRETHFNARFLLRKRGAQRCIQVVPGDDVVRIETECFGHEFCLHLCLLLGHAGRAQAAGVLERVESQCSHHSSPWQ